MEAVNERLVSHQGSSGSNRANLTKKESAECMKVKAGDHGLHSM